jgi:hypothetical protein
MNLNKLTKAELMLKFKKLQEATQSSKNTGIIAKLLLFKSLILKITIIAILIKTFKRYSILRKIWTVINTIIVSIFGISFMDIYGINIFSNILDTLRSTYVYSWFMAFFDSKQIEEIPSRMRTINQTSTGNEKGSGMIEGFKKLVIKEEIKIEEDDTPIYKNKWVLIAIILMLSGLTWWYFGDEIKPFLFPTDGGPRFRRHKRFFYNEETKKMEEIKGLPNVPTQDPSVERSWWNTIKDFFDISKWRGDNHNDITNDIITQRVIFDTGRLSDIELEDRINNLKGEPNKDLINPEIDNIHSNSTEQVDSINYYFDDKNIEDAHEITNLSGNELLAHLENQRLEVSSKIIQHITGEADHKFDLESIEIQGQVDNFLNYHDNNMFPSDTIKTGMYKVIKAKLVGMSLLNSIRYNRWLERTDVSNNISRFFNLDNSMKSIEEQSDTYNEIAMATAEEQDAWSQDGSRASTPGIEEIPIIETPKIEPKPLVSELIDKIEENIQPVKGKIDSLFDQIRARRLDSNVEEAVASSSKIKLEDLPSISKSQPSIDPNVSDESNSSLERYFPDKSEIEPIKEKPIIEEPPKIIITDTLDETPIEPENKSMFNSLFDSIKNLRKSPKVETLPDLHSKTEEETSQPAIITDEAQPSSGFLDLFKQIKSQRKEYGTPILDTKPLDTIFAADEESLNNKRVSIVEDVDDTENPIVTPINIVKDNPIVTPPVNEYPSVLNLFDDTNALFDSSDIEDENIQVEQEEVNTSTSSGVIDSWDQVKVNIFDKSKQVNIEFGDLWQQANSVHFSTTDNFLSTIDIENLGNQGYQKHSNENFVWDPITAQQDFTNSELKEIIIKDLGGQTHSIYKNEKYFT